MIHATCSSTWTKSACDDRYEPNRRRRSTVSSSEAEHEWSCAFRASAVPDLVAALAGCEREDILNLLQRRYASADWDEAERIIRER